MNRRNLLKRFRNGKDIGSYTNVRFTITGDTELGRESISFETDIHYLDIGEGDPILLVHGIGQSLYTWRNNVDFLVRSGYRVLAPDLPGFGYSGHPHIYYTAEEYGLILAAFLDSINIKHVHIAAFSTGCLSAVCFAADNTKRVGKLILISPGCPNANYPIHMKLSATWLGSYVLNKCITESAVRSVLQKMFFDATNITNEVVEGYLAPLRNKEVRETLSICMAHLDDSYPRSLMKKVKSETLIFYGSDDKLHDQQSVRLCADVIPDSRFIIIRNCAHLLHEEKPVKFNDEMLRFLKKSETDRIWVKQRRYKQEG